MSKNIQLETYTIADLKNWLFRNCQIKRLSSAVISPARAYAFIHNPFVKDNDQVVCALYVDDELAAFTAAFPELLQKPKDRLAWWFSTLWCNPKFEGRGFGLVVVGTLCDSIGEGNFFDAEGAPETVKIFELLGLSTLYVPRYYLTEKKIHVGSLKGKLAWCIEAAKRKACLERRNQLRVKLDAADYSVKYTSFVDNETYTFLLKHSEKDVLLRRQETFNWILKYPFMQESPVPEKVQSDNAFSDTINRYSSLLISVFSGALLVGVVLLVVSSDTMAAKYVYYERDKASIVYDAIADHIVCCHAHTFSTNDLDLYEYLKSLHLFTKEIVSNSSFSSPIGFLPDGLFNLQAGEGDMFV